MPELRHLHRSQALAAMMMFEFHGLVKTQGAVAVACSDLVRYPLAFNQRLHMIVPLHSPTVIKSVMANGKGKM